MEKFVSMKNNYDCPFYANGQTVKEFPTDMDHFPFTRHYRGEFESSKPVVFSRQAGYRPRDDCCYIPSFCPGVVEKPNHCFQGPCSLITPCKPPKHLRRGSTDNNFLWTIVDNSEIPTPP